MFDRVLVMFVRPHISADVPTVVMRRGACRRVSARRSAAHGTLCGALAASARPRDARGRSLAPLAAELRLRDARLDLVAPPAAPGGAGGSGGGGVLEAGAPDAAALVRALAREGLEARLEASAAAAGGGCIVHLPRVDTLVHLERHATHVFCEGDAAVRQALRRALAAATPEL